MSEKNRIKVVWLCAYSDSELRSHLEFPKWHWSNVLRRLLHKNNHVDYAVWDSNAIREFEKIVTGIELHVISPQSGIGHLQEFESKGVFYHIFWSEWDVMIEKIKRKLNIRNERAFRHHRRIICDLVAKIQPNIIHVFGIENKFHSMAVLDLPKNVPIIAQLQTLVSDDRFKAGSGAAEKEYRYNSAIEKLIISRCDYIGTKAKRFREIILRDIKPNAVFLDTSLALAEPVVEDITPKQFDFVYFAADISKAADLAIEAFAIAKKQASGISLDIIGGYSSEYKEQIDKRIRELGIGNSVFFEGKLPTHEDVISHIRKSRFALLPLKIDLISGTIREAQANGLPVVTTITPTTPNLNITMETALLSEVGDHVGMAKNMLRLIHDTDYSNALRINGMKLANERVSNKQRVEHYCKVYYDITNSSFTSDLGIRTGEV